MIYKLQQCKAKTSRTKYINFYQIKFTYRIHYIPIKAQCKHQVYLLAREILISVAKCHAINAM